jgi:hypothetical protein
MYVCMYIYISLSLTPSFIPEEIGLEMTHLPFWGPCQGQTQVFNVSNLLPNQCSPQKLPRWGTFRVAYNTPSFRTRLPLSFEFLKVKSWAFHVVNLFTSLQVERINLISIEFWLKSFFRKMKINWDKIVRSVSFAIYFIKPNPSKTKQQTALVV